MMVNKSIKISEFAQKSTRNFVFGDTGNPAGFGLGVRGETAGSTASHRLAEHGGYLG
jgi:hypothetical protein